MPREQKTDSVPGLPGSASAMVLTIVMFSFAVVAVALAPAVLAAGTDAERAERWGVVVTIASGTVDPTMILLPLLTTLFASARISGWDRDPSGLRARPTPPELTVIAVGLSVVASVATAGTVIAATDDLRAVGSAGVAVSLLVVTVTLASRLGATRHPDARRQLDDVSQSLRSVHRTQQRYGAWNTPTRRAAVVRSVAWAVTTGLVMPAAATLLWTSYAGWPDAATVALFVWLGIAGAFGAAMVAFAPVGVPLWRRIGSVYAGIWWMLTGAANVALAVLSRGDPRYVAIAVAGMAFGLINMIATWPAQWQPGWTVSSALTRLHLDRLQRRESALDGKAAALAAVLPRPAPSRSWRSLLPGSRPPSL